LRLSCIRVLDLLCGRRRIVDRRVLRLQKGGTGRESKYRKGKY